jgi:CarD family transcriptional regulator
MFAKGDKIVYPMYGAGIIGKLEEKQVDDKTNIYYVVTMPMGNLTIMVSALKAGELGIREINNKDVVVGIIKSVLDIPIEMSENWNQRHKDNMEKIKTGELLEVTLVYRNLLLRERERGLSSAEKKMLINAKHIILSEIIVSQDIDKSEAEQILIDCVNNFCV